MRPALAPLAHPVRTGWDIWSRFWFGPIPAARLGLLRIWLFGFVFVDVLLRKEAWVGLADIPRLFWHPVGATWLLDRVGVGPPNAWQIIVVQVVLAVAALLAAVGYRYRVSAPVAAILFLYWQCLGQSWGEMKHARVTLILALLFLCVVPAQQSRSVDSLRRRLRTAGREVRVVDGPPIDEPSSNGAWAVRAIQVALAALYFLSGYSKLRSIGIDWIWGDTLKQAIQDKGSSGEATELGYFVLRHTWMLIGFQAVSLVWEVGFPLVFFRRLRYPVLIVGLLFNIGLWTTVKIEFFGVVACFAAFLPLEQYEQAIRNRLGRRRVAAQRIRVYYDGWCPRCATDLTFMRAADWSGRIIPVDTRGGTLPAGFPPDRSVTEMMVETDGGVVSSEDRAVAVAKVLPPLLPLRPLLRFSPIRSVSRRIHESLHERGTPPHCDGSCPAPHDRIVPADDRVSR
jgi:predicted DCC family thiol-disulfide oxidoreductase YuxK